MPDLNVKLTVQTPSGPTVQSIRTVTVDSYETHNISLPPNSSNDAGIELTFLPSEAKDKVNMLLIQSSLYTGEKEGGAIQLSVGSIAEKSLSEPLLLLGTEVIEALGSPEKITLKNTLPTKKTEAVEPPAETAPPTGEVETPPVGETPTPTPAPTPATDILKEIDVSEENTAQISILIGRVEAG